MERNALGFNEARKLCEQFDDMQAETHQRSALSFQDYQLEKILLLRTMPRRPTALNIKSREWPC